MKKKFLYVFILALFFVTLLSLYACKGNTITVKFDTAGGSPVEDITVKKGKDFALPAPPVREGYTFEGWFYEGETNKVEGKTKVEKDVTLYAKWKINQYTYTFYDEDQTTVIKTATVDYGSQIVPPGDPQKATTAQYSYAFSSWSPAVPETISADISFTAVYASTVRQYTYTFYEEDGSTEIKTATVDYGSAIVPPAAPLKASTPQYSYTFSGWSPAVPETISSNISFTAVYTQTVRQYTYTFYDYDETTVLKTATVDYGSPIVPPKDPPRPPTEELTYTFSGWDRTIPEAITENIVFTACYTWAVRQYTVTFDTNGGSVIVPFILYYGNTVFEPSDPFRPGYEFCGWYTDDGTFQNPYNFTTLVTGDLTLYACWQALDLATIWNNSKDTLVEVWDIEEFLSMFKIYTSDDFAGAEELEMFDRMLVLDFEIPLVLAAEYNSGTAEEAIGSINQYFGPIFEVMGYNLNYAQFYDTNIICCDYFSLKFILGQNIVYENETYYTEDYSTLIRYKGDSESYAVRYGVSVIGHAAFNGRSLLKNIDLPDTLTEIGEEAFMRCKKLEEIIIPDGVTVIKQMTFYNCVELQRITLPSGLTKIGRYAFEQCEELEKVMLSENVAVIEEDAFLDCGWVLIYCAAPEKPAGWHADWNPDGCPVAWGYDGQEHIYYYESNGGEALDPVITADFIMQLPCPTREGFTFYGWYDNEMLEGEPIGYYYYSNTGGTLYAEWVSGTRGLEYRLINNGTEYEVIGIGTASIPNMELVIPLEYKGLPVTSIGDRAFYDLDNLIRVVVKDNVRTIGESAFDNSALIGEVILPQGLLSIGDYAFRYCMLLDNINIPGSVTYLGKEAFYDCNNLHSITIPGGIENILEKTFYSCSNLDSVVLKEGVKTIGTEAFYDCIGLSTIETSKSLQSIGDRAFAKSSIGKIVISKSVTSIGSRVFDDCLSLTIYCEALTGSPGWAADWNPDSRAVYWATDGVERTYVFMANGGTPVSQKTGLNVWTSPVTTWAEYVFSGWYDNEELSGMPVSFPYFSATAQTLYAAWEYGTEGLSYSLINNGTEYEVSGRGTASASNIIVPYYYYGLPVTGIGEAAFSYETISGVTLLEGIKTIGDAAFSMCTGLNTVNLPQTLLAILNCAFQGCSSLYNIVIPDGVLSIGEYAFDICNNLTGIVIPDSVVSLGEGAFYKCSNLESVTLSKGLEAIEAWTFTECSSLSSIIIAEKITYIGHAAFAHCVMLQTVETHKYITTIDKMAFDNCQSLSEIIIFEAVETIGQSAFNDCSALTIYCEADEEPVGWDADWNPDARPVVWSCTER